MASFIEIRAAQKQRQERAKALETVLRPLIERERAFAQQQVQQQEQFGRATSEDLGIDLRALGGGGISTRPKTPMPGPPPRFKGPSSEQVRALSKLSPAMAKLLSGQLGLGQQPSALDKARTAKTIRETELLGKPTEVKAPKTVTKLGADGKPHLFAFDPQTRGYTADVGIAAKPPLVSIDIGDRGGDVQKSTIAAVEKDILKVDEVLEKLTLVNETTDPSFLTFGGRADVSISNVKEKFGITLDREAKDYVKAYNNWASTLDQYVLAYRKWVTGVAGGEKEAEWIFEAIPTKTNAPTEFQSKLDQTFKVQTLTRDRLAQIQATGKILSAKERQSILFDAVREVTGLNPPISKFTIISIE